MDPDPSHRRPYWSVLARGGPVHGGNFDLPAIASWQVLAPVERLLAEAGIALGGRGG